MDGLSALLRDRLSRRGELARLSEESGIGANVLGRWRDGVSRPTPENLRKLAPALGVLYEDLLRLCGYLPGEAPTDALSESRRQRELARQQVEEWIAAVGEEYLPLLLDSWRSDAHNIIRFRETQGAVMQGQDTAVMQPVSRTRRASSHRRGNGETPISPNQRRGRSLLAERVAA